MSAVARTPRRSVRKKTGRPPAITDKVATRIIAALKKGAPYRLAAAAGGVSPNTLERIRDPESPTYDAAFTARCEEARELGFLRMYEIVARSPDWRAAWKRLEVGVPELFARRTIVAGDRDNPVRVHIEASLTASAYIRSDRTILMKIIDALPTDASRVLGNVEESKTREQST